MVAAERWEERKRRVTGEGRVGKCMPHVAEEKSKKNNAGRKETQTEVKDQTLRRRRKGVKDREREDS